VVEGQHLKFSFKKGFFMPHATSFLKTADGLTLFTQSWVPQGKPRAIVVIVHGYGEHSTRYTHVAESLVKSNYAVYSIDHRGHGKSEGLQAYFTSVQEAVTDLRAYFETIQKQHPGQKIFLYGHSMGSLIAIAFTLQYQNDITGLIVTGTALTGDETVPAPLIAVGQFLQRFIPRVPLLPGLPSSELASDPNLAKIYDSDPLVYRGAWRIGMGIGLIVEGRKLQSKLFDLKLPLLIMHGEADKITPISGGYLVRDRAGSIDKTFKSYPGMRHEIHNDRSSVDVIDTIVQWLDARS